MEERATKENAKELCASKWKLPIKRIVSSLVIMNPKIEKVEITNNVLDRRTIHKTCGEEIEDVSCTQSQFGSKLVSHYSHLQYSSIHSFTDGRPVVYVIVPFAMEILL